MKRGLLAFYMFVAIFGVYETRADSSDVMFSEDVVHYYELEFYVPDWTAQLEANKDSGEIYLAAKLTYHHPGIENIVLDSVGVRYKGNSSYFNAKNSPKKSFKLSFDEYRDQTFFGCEKINLNNCDQDPSYLREKIGYDIIRKYMPAPRTAFAVLSVAGTMIGVYTQVEQVDDLFLERNFQNPDGNLYKAGDDGATLEYINENQSTYEAIYELKTNERKNDWSGFVDMVYKLNKTDKNQFAATMRGCLNVDNCMRYLAWTMLLSNFDSYTGSGRNYYLYDDPASGQFMFIPWDVNLAFGRYPGGWDAITNDVFAIPNLNTRPLNRRILENDSLKFVYAGMLREMMAGAASPESIATAADRWKTLIDSVVQVEPDTSKAYTYQQFLTNIDSNLVISNGLNRITVQGIKTFPALRYAAVEQQIQSGVIRGRSAMKSVFKSSFSCSWNSAVSSISVAYAYKNVTAATTTAADLVLIDSRGRVIKKTTLNDLSSGNSIWRIGVIAPGVYSVIMVTETTTLSSRVIVL